ncbi:MAG: sigma-70 family RNA polymerase sigma factor [Lachnospiraceae bacterium]|nr:sigma-70 family RNA polymerase sigma factor [Lachnospiraceae bacterium]
MQREKPPYEELYKGYSSKILYYLKTKINNKEEAEDLHSVIFTKAFEKYDSFDSSKASVSTWLYTIANNTVIDYFRTRHVNEDIEDNPDLQSDNSDFENILNEETLNELADALTKIEPREKDLIILHYNNGLTLKETAVKLGISYSNCKLIHNRALMELKRLMSF